MRNPFRKSVRSVACAVICAVVCANPVTAYASQPESRPGLIEWISNLIAGESGEIPRAEFVNDSNDTPDLYVKKTVKSAVPEIDPPADSEFHFTIMVDGEYYQEQNYELYGSDGSQLHNYTDANGATHVEVPFTTDRNGGFYLKDGQTARFPWVGPNKAYEVFEELSDGSFIQTYPAGNAHAVGHVEATGSSIEFVNTWYPETKTEVADLEVAKSVLMPEGFELPETPEFEFEVKVSYKPYANKKYSVKDESGTVVSEGTTNQDGHLKLKGGQTAVFEEVEAGRDYSVGEVNVPEGWRQTGVTGEEGATKGPATHAEFTNAFASFAVSKRMEGYSYPDAEFAFVLSGDAGPMSGVKYWLYDKDKKLMDTAAKTTGADGKFTLKPGETALFTGIASGTNYTIHEESSEGYVQTFPDGDVSGTVRDDALPVHEFVNAASGTAKLTLKKVDPEGAALANVKFKLRQGRGGLFAAYAVLEEKDGAWDITDWASDGTELTTDENGEIVITGFEEGFYTLEETESLNGYGKLKPVTFQIRFIVSDQNELVDITLDPDTQSRSDVSLQGSMKDGTGVLKLVNRESPEMPVTGGSGMIRFLIPAALLCIVAGLLIRKISNKRKESSKS